MDSFKDHINEAETLKFYNLLPKKVRHAINRFAHQDKYKGALTMYHGLKKNKDVKTRNLSDKKLKGIAADFFKLSHGEFDKILNRKTRYEDKEMVRLRKGNKEVKVPKHRVDFYLGQHYKLVESHTINPTKVSDISKLPQFSKDEKIAAKKLHSELKTQTNDPSPIIFNDDGKDKEIKIKRIHKPTTDLNKLRKIENLPKIIYGDGSVKKRTVKLKQFGIKNDTQFIEFCQSIGFFISEPLAKGNFKTLLNGLTINGDFKIREFIDGWKKFVTLCYADLDLRSDMILLVNGSYFYKDTVKLKNPYVIWTDIKTYYTKLKTKEGITGDVKENTADCVLIDGNKDALYKVLEGKKPIKSNEKTGMLSCGGINWYQISLKKVKGGAKLGKITSLIKGMYDIEQSNIEASGLETIYKELELEQINIEFHQILQEGLFSDGLAKFKDLGKVTLNAFKAAVVKIKKWSGDLFKNMTKLLKQETKKEDRFMRSLMRGKLNEKKATAAEVMTAIVNDKGPRGGNLKYVKHVEDTFGKVKSVNNDAIKTNIIENKGIEVNKTSIAFLASNVISFGILNKITADVTKNGIDVINTMNASMQMGDTKLPVVKVYGNKTGPSIEILTVGSISQTDPSLENKDTKLCLLSIKPEGKYYVINMFVFAELKNNEPHYHKISFKKHAEADLTFDIEGAKTAPLSKIREFK